MIQAALATVMIQAVRTATGVKTIMGVEKVAAMATELDRKGVARARGSMEPAETEDPAVSAGFEVKTGGWKARMPVEGAVGEIEEVAMAALLVVGTQVAATQVQTMLATGVGH